jgi:capsular polysaccharide biosynthesis protein
MIPRLRGFAGEAMVVMTSDSLSRPFQRDLVTRTLAARRVLPLQGALRLRDPVLAHDGMSEEGVLWLRATAAIAARPGGRRIYIRRSAQGTRPTAGGGLSESAGLRTLLRDFDFETIDFGDGELGVAAQVAKLDGAGLILAAHGAALTNLAYLDRGLKVIEIIGARTQSACFMHLAAVLGFEYRGIFSDAYDEGLDIVVDRDELRDVLRGLA